MKCKRCGTELKSDDEFCYHCGERTTLMQRMVASRMFAGSLVVIIFVIAIAILAFLILTDRVSPLEWFGKDKKPQSPIVAEEPDKGQDSGAPVQTETPEPTATPFVFEPSDVTEEMTETIKPLVARMKPFLAFSASIYADEPRMFRWNDATATVAVLYKLEQAEGAVKYGDSFSSVKKKVKKEMKDIFGSNYKFKLRYGQDYPDYLYNRTGNTVYYSAAARSDRLYRVKPERAYRSETEKIIEYRENRYRAVAKAYLVTKATGQKDVAQRYTILLREDENSAYGYTIDKIRLYKKGDKKAS